MATFRDGSKIHQFDLDGTENKFQLVIDRFNDLKYFDLTNNLDKTFTVDINCGLIFFNNFQSIENKEIKKNCRLIHFRRHQVEMNENCIEKSHIIEYHLGFQYNDKLGNNRQIVLQIDSEGNWILIE
jgi:hypothetical protein